jgi:hypothetical protein
MQERLGRFCGLGFTRGRFLSKTSGAQLDILEVHLVLYLICLAPMQCAGWALDQNSDRPLLPHLTSLQIRIFWWPAHTLYSHHIFMCPVFRTKAMVWMCSVNRNMARTPFQ